MARLAAGLCTGVLLALLMPGGAAMAQGEDAPPREATADDSARFVVDTRVEDVVIDDEVTLAILAPSPQSRCPSDRYVLERVRPKWLNTTGRLMQARKEGALLRISFSCVRGYQSINAIQFLSPPSGRVAGSMSLRGAEVQPEPGGRAALDRRRAAPPGAIGAEGRASAAAYGTETERLGGAPLPEGTALGPAPAGALLPAPGSAAPAAGGPPLPTGRAEAGGDGQPYRGERVRAIPRP